FKNKINQIQSCTGNQCDIKWEVAGNHWQVNEALWDVGGYFAGASNPNYFIASDINKTGESLKNASEAWCQPNHVIVIASGLDSNNQQTRQGSRVSNLVPEYEIHGSRYHETNDNVYIAKDPHGTVVDVSRHLYNNLSPAYLNIPPSSRFRVKTHVLQVFGYLEQFYQAAQFGGGIYRQLDNPNDIARILPELIGGLLEVDSSFVAPIVPSNPEIQSYSGNRIYLGLFKPQMEEPWCGNIKKFIINDRNQMFGFDPNNPSKEVAATNQIGDFLFEADGTPSVRSFWSDEADGGLVDRGGVGGLLLESSRNIFTYKDNKSPVEFNYTVDNGNIKIDSYLDDLLDYDDSHYLIRFVRGDDEVRNWLKGDVIHSKPVVFNYDNKSFTYENENKDSNKSYIFVGGNDGMLHAYRDYNGSEAWAFIPSELIPNLKYLLDRDRHYYFMDASPVIYVHDKKGDGIIDKNEDLVMHIFGMRRGGGSSILENGHSASTYYALNITDPENPTFMWKRNSSYFGFEEMGQSWSLPTPAKIKICDGDDCETKIVAVIGGGYDTNEDTRFGASDLYTNNGANSITISSAADSGEGPDSSVGTNQPINPKGRGIFIVEIATISADKIADTTKSGNLLWSATHATNNLLTHSFPSDPLIVDRNSDGYADTIYIGDAGGQLWRVDIGSTELLPKESEESGNTLNITKIFESNTTSDNGRKVFFKPTALVSGHDTFVYFGTGDREHPLNTGLVDRLYMVRDRQKPGEAFGTPGYFVWDYDKSLTEDNLVDVTNYDYNPGDMARLMSPHYVADPNANASGTNKVGYGWYIKLNENGHEGEKVLASPRVFDGKAYFTTYQPTLHNPDEGDDPCVGLLGPARIYIVDAFSGKAVFNLSTKDEELDDEGNFIAVLDRADRFYEIGRGIASEPIVRVDRHGNVSVLIGRGGGFFNSADNPEVDLGTFDPLQPIYWMKW
ncbi:MAG: pilus assembly protein, partial [Anaerolineales bacterium]